MSKSMSVNKYKSQWGTQCWVVDYSERGDDRVLITNRVVSEWFGDVPQHVIDMVDRYNAHYELLSALENLNNACQLGFGIMDAQKNARAVLNKLRGN